MDPLSLATTAVGLFGACMTLFDKFSAFQDAGASSGSYVNAFGINKLLLERWGRSVGIEKGGLLPKHDDLLDDPAVVRQVSRVLADIEDLCAQLDKSLEAASRNREEPKPLRRALTGGLGARDSGAKGKDGPSALAKFDWVVRSHAKSKATLEELRNKLADLFKLVPAPDAQLEKLLLESHAQMEDKIKNEVKAWLAAPWNTDVYNRACKTRLPNTCEWILGRDFFSSWLSDDFPDAKPKVLWISGPAGYGKTILCAKVAEHISPHHDADRLVAHYFVSAESGVEHAPFSIIKSWLFQLISQSSAALHVALELHDPRGAPTASQDDVVRVLNCVLRELSGITLIADGLDECAWVQESRAGDQDRNSTLGFFASVAEAVAGTQTRILLVSRREEAHLRPAFSTQLAYSPHISTAEHSIAPDDVRPDAKAFSQEIARKNKILSKRSGDQQTELAEKMLVKSDGMFLWMKMLEGDLSKANNTKKIFRAVEQAPSGIEHLYIRNWERIVNNPDSSARAKAFTILRWAAFSPRPLTVLQLIEALTIPEDEDADDLDDDELPDEMEAIDEDYVQAYIVDLCGSLVEARRPERGGPASDIGSGGGFERDRRPESGEISLAARKTINIVHFSVREFLRGRLPFDAGLSSVDERLANSDIGYTRHLTFLCLRYLGMLRPLAEQLKLGDESYKRRFLRVAIDAFYSLLEGSDQVSVSPKLAGMVHKLIDPRREVWGELRRHCWGLGAKNAKTPDYPILRLAAELGVESLRYVLSNVKIPATAADGWGETALHRICDGFGWSEAAFELLLQHGADVNALRISESPLMVATRKGLLPAVKLLLKHGARQIPTEEGYTPLHHAFSKNTDDMELPQLLIDHGADVNATSKQLMTPLHRACFMTSQKVAAFLLDKGAHINAKRSSGRTALHIAASWNLTPKENHLAFVKLLLSRGADLESRDNSGSTPVHLAAMRGEVDCLKVLADHGACLRVQDDGGKSPLHVAAAWGQAEGLTFLLDRSADSEGRIREEATPVHQAASQKRSGCLEALADHGAWFDAPDKGGWSPLHTAAGRGQVDCLKILLDRGADFDRRNNEGTTPVHEAACQKTTDCLEVLADCGACLEAQDDAGSSPLHYAANIGSFDCLKLLLDRGVDPDGGNFYNRTPLHYAAKNGHVDCLRLLSDLGAQVGSVDDDGWSPLHWAARKGHVGALMFLVDAGLDPTQPDPDGRTVLHWAARFGSEKMLDLFLGNGSLDALSPDKHGISSLAVAVGRGHATVAARLLASTQGCFDSTDSRGRSLLWWARRSSRVIFEESRRLNLSRRTLFFEHLLMLDVDPESLVTEETLWLEAEEEALALERTLRSEADKRGGGAALREPASPPASRSDPCPDFGSGPGWSCCDVCLQNISGDDPHYSCGACGEGKFRACQECFDLRVPCAPYHVMRKHVWNKFWVEEPAGDGAEGAAAGSRREDTARRVDTDWKDERIPTRAKRFSSLYLDI